MRIALEGGPGPDAASLAPVDPEMAATFKALLDSVGPSRKRPSRTRIAAKAEPPAPAATPALSIRPTPDRPATPAPSLPDPLLPTADIPPALLAAVSSPLPPGQNGPEPQGYEAPPRPAPASRPATIAPALPPPPTQAAQDDPAGEPADKVRAEPSQPAAPTQPAALAPGHDRLPLPPAAKVVAPASPDRAPAAHSAPPVSVTIAMPGRPTGRSGSAADTPAKPASAGRAPESPMPAERLLAERPSADRGFAERIPARSRDNAGALPGFNVSFSEAGSFRSETSAPAGAAPQASETQPAATEATQHLADPTPIPSADVVISLSEDARLDVTLGADTAASVASLEARLEAESSQLEAALSALGTDVEAIRVELRPARAPDAGAAGWTFGGAGDGNAGTQQERDGHRARAINPNALLSARAANPAIGKVDRYA